MSVVGVQPKGWWPPMASPVAQDAFPQNSWKFSVLGGNVTFLGPGFTRLSRSSKAASRAGVDFDTRRTLDAHKVWPWFSLTVRL